MSDEKLLEVVDLQAGYNGMAVVHDVSFSVREGEILAILGSNGSGKTTSAVDTATDARIREAFGAAIPRTTKIIIAQRISSVQHADHILVIEEGSINGYGTHDQLVRSNEIYREIYESQSRGGGDFDQVQAENAGKESVA